jgi:hypothetical protein
LDDRENKQKQLTIDVSNTSNKKAQDLIQRMPFAFVNHEFLSPIHQHFEPFIWLGDEPSGTPAACLHLKDLLTQAGVNFDTEFQLEDCHTNKQLLDFVDDNIGTITGGTDLVITPKGTADVSLPHQICVVVELKTTTTMNEKGISAFNAPAIVEFVSANCLSYQPSIMAVLTDLNSHTKAWVSRYDPVRKQIIALVYSNLSLDAMVTLMAEHLNTAVVKDNAFLPLPSSTIPEAQRSIVIKRKFAEGGITDAWAQFEDLADGTEDWSRDRALATWNLLRNCGIDRMPTVVHHCMYT